MADEDDRALLDRTADDGAPRAGTAGGSSQPTARLNGKPASRRRRLAVAFAGLAVGVATAGAFLLPRLQADLPAGPLELPSGALELPQPVRGDRCRSEPTSHADI